MAAAATFDRNFWIPSLLCCVVSIPLNNHDAPPAFRIDLLAESPRNLSRPNPLAVRSPKAGGERDHQSFGAEPDRFSPMLCCYASRSSLFFAARRQEAREKACSECHPLCTVNGRWDPQFSNEPRHFFFFSCLPGFTAQAY